MPRRRSIPTPKVISYEAMSGPQRDHAMKAILRIVRDALQRGPHTALELRAGVPRELQGAFPAVLETMITAGEVAAVGHSVYIKVPWMPQTRRVEGNAARDLILGTLSTSMKSGATADELSHELFVPLAQVRLALTALENAGLIHETHHAGRYRMLSLRQAQHVRRGAAGRFFADVRHG